MPTYEYHPKKTGTVEISPSGEKIGDVGLKEVGSGKQVGGTAGSSLEESGFMSKTRYVRGMLSGIVDSPNPISIIVPEKDSDGKIKDWILVFANKSWMKYQGGESKIDRPVKKPNDEADESWVKKEQVFKTGRPSSYERWDDVDGDKRRIRVELTPAWEVDENNKRTSIAGVIRQTRDITDEYYRQESEKTVRALQTTLEVDTGFVNDLLSNTIQGIDGGIALASMYLEKLETPENKETIAIIRKNLGMAEDGSKHIMLVYREVQKINRIRGLQAEGKTTQYELASILSGIVRERSMQNYRNQVIEIPENVQIEVKGIENIRDISGSNEELYSGVRLSLIHISEPTRPY